MAQQEVQEERKQKWAYRKSMEESVNWFNDQYPDIANNSDPTLIEVVCERDQKIFSPEKL